jgi:hypothetical protein
MSYIEHHSFVHTQIYFMSLHVWLLQRGGPFCQEKEMKQSFINLCNAIRFLVHKSSGSLICGGMERHAWTKK